jgi:hypothetical protein
VRPDNKYRARIVRVHLDKPSHCSYLAVIVPTDAGAGIYYVFQHIVGIYFLPACAKKDTRDGYIADEAFIERSAQPGSNRSPPKAWSLF